MDKAKSYIRITELISEEFTGELTVDQKVELESWIKLSPENKLLYEKLKSKEGILENIKETEKINKEFAWEKINAGIDKKKVFRLSTSGFLKYAAIIVLPLLIGIVVQRTLLNNKIEIITEDIIEDDIAPGLQKAVLTLSDGTEINLDKNKDETISTKNNSKIRNEDNTLEYLAGNHEPANVSLIFNTLKTPRGGEYNLVLADGSKVWLNADTKLKYPVNFSSDIRQVFLSGEAYFEVKHNSERPFIVTANTMDVTVLGTSFNVMAYTDENQTQATLIAGKVSVTEISDKKSKTILSPGYQASLDINSKTISSRKVDTDTYTAWKDGRFVFMNEDLNSIMRKLSRWYDIVPVFNNENLKNYHFTGTLKRYDSINDILEKIELTTNVSFDIGEGSVIISRKE
jgi:transmembrane sensor